MTRNRESVLLTNSLKAATHVGNALAMLPEDQHPAIHAELTLALHNVLIAAEEIRQQWQKGAA